MKYRIKKKVNNISGKTWYYIEAKKTLWWEWLWNWESTGWCCDTLEEAQKKIDDLMKHEKNPEEITYINYPE